MAIMEEYLRQIPGNVFSEDMKYDDDASYKDDDYDDGSKYSEADYSEGNYSEADYSEYIDYTDVW